jgi:hypothetical protein
MSIILLPIEGDGLGSDELYGATRRKRRPLIGQREPDHNSLRKLKPS